MTGPGQPVYELLRKERLRVDKVTFTNENKEAMVHELCLKLEQEEIVLPSPACGEPYDVLMDELTAFERRRSHSGLHYTYSAPEGLHDDCVSALMLAICGQETRHHVSILSRRGYELRYGKPYPGDSGNWETIENLFRYR